MEININAPLENLKRVISRYDVFLHNLKWCKDEKAVDELTLELKRDKEFYNVCRKAKNEIEAIVYNDKKTILEPYFLQYQNIDKIKKEWEKEVREGNKNISRMYITIVNVDLGPINDVFFTLQNSIDEDKIYIKNNGLTITNKLIGREQGHNPVNTLQPVFHYIDDLLIEYNLTNKDAIRLILKHAGDFPLRYNKFIIPQIINYLK